ncbi:hypothetical protein AB0870_03215 [Microbacterium proteolyticum]|uniref:hypothetical protein n=1 Tax=Microbacterium proteolyticum TaxID=1572644 RepID=UPI002416FB1C|nr:hypothetical protein [Microbacterium proteolyticum]
MPDAIKVGEIPGDEIKPEVVEENARTIGTISGQVSEHGSNVHFKWQGMAGVYEAPESPTLLGLMAPVSSQATQVGDNLAEVSAALVAFAADVRPIKAELDSLRAQAQAFVDSIRSGVRVQEVNPAWTAAQSSYGGATAMPTYQGSWGSSTTGSSTAAAPEQYRTVTKEWHESQEHVDRNNELIAAVNAQQVKLWEAERACANRIRALYGAQPLHAATSEDDALGYGISEIPEGTDVPWGAEVERTEDCAEGTVRFVVKDFLWEGIIVGGLGGTIGGLLTLTVGFDPATWTFFSPDAYGAAWGGMLQLGVGLALQSEPNRSILWADDVAGMFGARFLPPEVQQLRANAGEAWLTTGKALIAWDKWQDDPGTALGESVFNVGTILVPAGAAVSGVKTAAGATSAIARTGEVGSAIVRGTARAGQFFDLTSHLAAGVGKLSSGMSRVIEAAVDRLRPSWADDVSSHVAAPLTLPDAETAMRTLQDAGVDMNTVVARTDAGIPVYEFPPTSTLPAGRIELPPGAWPEARGGGAVDAAVPVREPELVAAGGVRGETGPGPVASIVDESPPRSETGAGAESGGGHGHIAEAAGGGRGGGHGGSGAGWGHGDDGIGAGPGDDLHGGTPDDLSGHGPRDDVPPGTDPGDGAHSGQGVDAAVHPRFEHTPEWLQRILDRDDLLPWERQRWNGVAFDYEQRPRYPENEVLTADGKRLDSYVSGREIVSRKYTQLSEISEETAKRYIAEIERKYSPGTVLADGRRLRGEPFLEVPVQRAEIPRYLIEYCRTFDPEVHIRDVRGHVYD